MYFIARRVLHIGRCLLDDPSKYSYAMWRVLSRVSSICVWCTVHCVSHSAYCVVCAACIVLVTVSCRVSCALWVVYIR